MSKNWDRCHTGRGKSLPNQCTGTTAFLLSISSILLPFSNIFPQIIRRAQHYSTEVTEAEQKITVKFCLRIFPIKWLCPKKFPFNFHLTPKFFENSKKYMFIYHSLCGQLLFLHFNAMFSAAYTFIGPQLSFN